MKFGKKRMKEDTIVAAATPLGQAGAVGIVRMSGSRAKKLAERVFSGNNLDFSKIEPNKMYLGKVFTKNFSDKAFCMYCKGPKSYTGEDIIELHLHGGTTLVKGVIRELVDRGARPADPGEFTKRAYLNGKKNLIEAEGIADMINAESDAQIMQAYRLMSGEVSKTIEKVSSYLLEAAANLEASLDYIEELEEQVKDPTKALLKKALEELELCLKNSESRKYITEGINIALAGLTNVGKSSLMNVLLKDERAIVTDIPGTTRDVIKEGLMIDGIKINLIDTAGIRESIDEVEKMGIERAKREIEGADIVLFIMDASTEETEEEKEIFQSIENKRNIRVENKGDILKYPREKDITIEATTGKNIDKLINLIMERTDAKTALTTTVLTRERHLYAIKEGVEHIKSALINYDRVTTDCTLVDIKAGYRSMLKITGEDLSETIVDKIFSTFCVGK